MVALYHATNGDYWTRNDNWLTGPIDTWYGVILSEQRVTELRLRNNNLQGELPTKLSDLRSLTRYDLSKNNIDKLPPSLFSSSPVTYGSLYGNRLTFKDFVIQQSDFKGFNYQQYIGKDTTVILNQGQNYTINLEIDQDVVNNRYIWSRDWIAIDTTDSNSFTILDVSAEDEGVYSCEIINPDVPYLQIYSRPVGIFIDYHKGSTSEQDSLALVKLYHATNGDRWVRNDNWLTGPLDTWYGVNAGKAWGSPDNKPRVHQVFLANNQLEGELPNEIKFLTYVYQFDVSYNKLTGTIPMIRTTDSNDSVGFSNNYFTSISPEFDRLPSTLIINQNHLSFEDLLPVLAKDSAYYSGDYVWYEHSGGYDQKPISRDTVVTTEEISDYTIDLRIDLTIDDNEYVWFKDSIAIDTTNVSQFVLSQLSVEDSGLYTCQITNPTAPGVTLHSGKIHLQVTTDRQLQTITFDSLPNRTVNDSLVLLKASTTSDLPITYRITEGEGTTASFQGDSILVVGAGRVTIEASQDGDENYLPAKSVTRSFFVSKLSQRITFTEITGAWVGDTLVLTAPTSSGLPVEFEIIGPAQLNGNQLILTDTGQVTITAQQAGNDFYAAAEPVTQTIRVEARPKEVPSTYYVSGSIWQNEQVPQLGATVLLFQRNDNGRYVLRTQASLEGHTYRFEGLSEGFYTIGAVVSDTSYLPTYRGGHYLLLNAEAVYLEENTEGLDITSLPAPIRPAQGNAIIRGTLVGRVSVLNGRTAYANDDPLPNVHVYLQDALTGQLVAHTITNDAGQFEFTGLPAGEYQLVADYEGGNSANVLSVIDHQEVVVIATVTDTLTITSEEVTDLITSTDERREVESVKWFPNPVTDQLTVEIGSPRWAGGIISVQNILGHTLYQKVIQRPSIVFEMAGQEAGIYVLTIRKEKNVIIRKIIK